MSAREDGVQSCSGYPDWDLRSPRRVFGNFLRSSRRATRNSLRNVGDARASRRRELEALWPRYLIAMFHARDPMYNQGNLSM